MPSYLTKGRDAAIAFAIAAATLGAASPAIADVKDGVDAWSRGDYPAAVKQWQGPAASGDADAQFNLAQAYKLGRGVPQDLPRAETLFGRAAAQGHLQAADNLGLLMFQRGERTAALPYIKAASGRGDPRAHYVLGLAHFNGDVVAKDWERAYALMSLAQQAGLPQAAAARARMDEHIPIAQRQNSVALAAKIAAQTEQARRAQVAAVDLEADRLPPRTTALRPFTPDREPSPSAPGADYTPGRAPPVSGIMQRETPPASAATLAPRKAPVKGPTAPAGAYRVQLGAFGVAGNADKLWDKVKARPELAGRSKLLVKAGNVSKLQAGGFADLASAQAACDRLKAGGIDCLATKD